MFQKILNGVLCIAILAGVYCYGWWNGAHSLWVGRAVAVIHKVEVASDTLSSISEKIASIEHSFITDLENLFKKLMPRWIREAEKARRGEPLDEADNDVGNDVGGDNQFTYL